MPVAGLLPRCPEVPCTDQPPLPPASQCQPILLTSDLTPHTLLRPLRSAPSSPRLQARLCPFFNLKFCRESWPLPSAHTSARPPPPTPSAAVSLTRDFSFRLIFAVGPFLSGLFLLWTPFKVFIGFVALLLLFDALVFLATRHVGC